VVLSYLFVQLFYTNFVLVKRHTNYGHGSDQNISVTEHIYYCAFVGLSYKYIPCSFFQWTW